MFVQLSASSKFQRSPFISHSPIVTHPNLIHHKNTPRLRINFSFASSVSVSEVSNLLL
jgi:hypothetical protein